MDCLFCGIVSGDVPANVVFEDDETLAFLDIQPGTEGHTLVVPKVHATDVFDISPESLAAVMRTAQKVAIAQESALGAAGVNLIQSSRPAAWQTVFHLHCHVIPRYPADGLRLPWTPTPTEGADLVPVAARLSGELS